MPNYNYFGATIAGVLEQFAVGGYVPTSEEFGGDSAIQAVMAEYETKLEQALTPEVFRMLFNPDLAILVQRATQGQMVGQVPSFLLPIKPPTFSVWIGPPTGFQLRPRLRTEIGVSFGDDVYRPGATVVDNDRFASGNYKIIELPPEQFTIDNATGVVTLLAPQTLNRDDRMYGSWTVDPTDPTYSVPSLASILQAGVAAKIGSKVYSRQQDAWQYVQTLAQDWTDAISALMDGTRIPSELRLLRWWEQVEKTSETTAHSARKFRS